MKAIRFEGDEEWQKQCWQSIRKRVDQYFKTHNISRKCNPAMVIKSLAMFSFYIVPFILLFILTKNNWLALPLTLMMGIGKAGIGMAVMHDGLHGSYSDKKWVNDLMGSSMYLIGSNVFNWKIQHNIFHHAYTNINGLDEDIQSRWILRLSEHTPLKKIHSLQHIYAYPFYTLMTFSMLFGDYSQLIGYHKAEILKKYQTNLTYELLKMSIVKMAYFFVMLVLPLLLTDYTFWEVLIGFVFIHLVAGFIMTLIFQLAHIVEGNYQADSESNTITNEWAIHQLRTTSNFARNNVLLNWYVGGLNFQIEHHLFPHICHIHYRHISPIVEQTVLEYGMSYNMKSTFLKALQSHSKRLRELGRK